MRGAGDGEKQGPHARASAKSVSSSMSGIVASARNTARATFTTGC